MFGGGQLAYLANLRGLLVINALRRGVCYTNLCLFLALLPARRLSSHAKPALQPPPRQPIYALAASFEGEMFVGLAHMTKSLTTTVWRT